MFDRLQTVFASLQRHDVEYLVIGGIAAVVHGVPRATFDLDILLRATPDNARRLLEALFQAGLETARMTDVERLLGHEITIFNDWVRINVQTSTPGLNFEDAWSRRETISFRGQSFIVVSRGDLIASKRAAGRSEDLKDIQFLEGLG